MEVFSVSADKDEKVKNVFKKLLDRIALKRTTHKKSYSPSVPLVKH